jgi:Arc/MetJ-type ribon-helix-helix transcriptional regulator
VSASFPPDVQHFVDQKLAAGCYPTEHELLVEAIRNLRDDEAAVTQFRAQLQDRLAALDRGEGVTLDGDEDLASFFAQIEAEVDAEISSSRRGAP